MADAYPVKVTRKLYRGDTRRWTHVIEENIGTKAEPEWVPVDITGYTFLSQFRDDLNRGDLIAEATCTVTDGPNGVLTEYLSADQADLLPGQTDPTEKPVVYWDLEGTSPDGDRQTYKYAQCPVGGDASDV